MAPLSALESPTFEHSVSVAVDDEVGAASISPAGRDVVLAGRQGLRIIDLDSLYSLPAVIHNQSAWDVADVQWSPFAARAEWIASTRNQLALVYNLSMPYNSKKPPIEYTLRAHDRAITDINFSAHHPDLLATCGVDSFIFVHDLRTRQAPLKLADFTAGATQVKWNRQNDKIIASAHDKYLHIWDTRNGATPLSTIAAHDTKIYGIDWDRSNAGKIMTCSLDYTIKLWSNVDSRSNITIPQRVIRTHYPVWRARHTPFPHGILAMPQRGNSSLWLYRHDLKNGDRAHTNDSAHAFDGHQPEAQVREFLWRSRGNTDDGIDSREFQLVTWGTDKHLRLHRLSPKDLASWVGFEKGKPLVDKPTTTRRGAAYISYRDGSIPTATTTRNEYGPPRHQQKGNLTSLFRKYPHSDETNNRWPRRENSTEQAVEAFSQETMTAVPIRRNNPRVVTHITWMDGIKFGNRRPHDASDVRSRSSQELRDGKHAYQEQNDLGAEISHVGNKYKKLAFEEIDVPGRKITVSFSSPWGDYDTSTDEAKLVFLRFTIKFPIDYPKVVESLDLDCYASRTAMPLEIEFEKTTAAISQDNQDELTNNMRQIAEVCAEQEREALEAVVSYALGERGLSDSLRLPEDDHTLNDLEPLMGEESSSDDDEHEGEFTNDVMQTSHTNPNVPLPIQCSVRFSHPGLLVVARVRQDKSVPPLDAVQLRLARNIRHGLTGADIFDSFGRFGPQHAIDDDDASSRASSIGSWETSTSPSSSSGSDRALPAHTGNFQPPLAWQKAASRFQSRNSLPSSSGAAKSVTRNKPVVSVLSLAVDELIPTKKVLAEEYRIFGSGPELCEYNAVIARRHGFDDLADIWILCKLILNNKVPLEILPQQHRKDEILVLARRALVRIKRKDSGLDLQFDDADSVTDPKLIGRIKWGNHAVANWLIPALFDHFERLADIQMLAMLSCVFAEPAARQGVPSTMAKIKVSQLPMSMEAPAYSLDYFSSADAAWSLFKPSISIPSTPAHSRHATPAQESGWQKSSRSLGTYGSHGSSNGPWGSDTVPSEPVTPFSTGSTPPMALSRASTTKTSHTVSHTPYSTSPEQSHSNLKRSSTANFASAVAALSRPFANALSSSPPVKSRVEDLSTSAPASGVTWGTTTFYGSGSQERNNPAPSRSKHSKRASFGQTDRINVNYVDDSDSDYDRMEDSGYNTDGVTEYATPMATSNDSNIFDAGSIRVTLKNQNLFDDESCVSKPLLDMSKDWLHRAWREQYAEMLGCWGLVTARAEILKYNGLVSYFPSQESRTRSKSGSISLALENREEKRSEDAVPKRTLPITSAPALTSATPELSKHTPATSAGQFSFNPEAREFQPSTPVFGPTNVGAPLPPDVFISSEQYLRLSIPTPPTASPAKANDSFIAVDDSGQNGLHPFYNRSNRPTLSRGASNLSRASSTGGRTSSVVPSPVHTPSATPTGGPAKIVYSCSICWIRVCGRFFLCPTCGHVAHFTCIDVDLNMNEGECVVGCGCGCGVEDEVDRSRTKAYIEEIRAVHAAGVVWDENGWLHVHGSDDSMPPTPGAFGEGPFGDSERTASGEEKRRLRNGTRNGAGAGGSRRREKGKTDNNWKRRARVSALSYY